VRQRETTTLYYIQCQKIISWDLKYCNRLKDKKMFITMFETTVPIKFQYQQV